MEVIPDGTDAVTEVTMGNRVTTERSYFAEYKLALLVQAYASIIIIIIGIIGNILVIAVLCQKCMRSSTSLFLLNLAVSDLGVMCIGQLSRVLPRAFLGFDTANYHPWICKCWFFVNHTFATMSSWTLVAVTIERVIAVYQPLKAKKICSQKAAKFAILAIDVLCCSVHLHYFWTYGEIVKQDGGVIIRQKCSIIKDGPDSGFYITMIRPWQDFVIRSAFPFFCLFVCNIMIVVKLCLTSKRRNNLSTANVKDNTAMKSLTFMLLTVNLAYLLCISPLQIMYLIDKSDPFGWDIRYHWQAVAALRWAFAIDVYYLNHAINFILYCISGREFRKALKLLFIKLFCSGKLKRQTPFNQTARKTSIYRVPSVTSTVTEQSRV